MFLAALNVINRYFYFVFAATALLALTPGRKLRLPSSALFLTLMSLFILIFDPTNQDRILDMAKPFVYPMCYILGTSVFTYSPDAPVDLQKEERNISAAIFVMAGGALTRFILNMITNWSSTSRNVIDFWTKSEMAATGQAALASIAVAVAVAFLFANAGKLKKIIGIATLIMIVTYNLVLAGRTLFIMIALLAVVALLYQCITQKRKMTKTVIITLVVILVLITLYNSNAFGLKTTFETSNFYLRFYGGQYSQEMNEDSRMQYKMGHLSYFFDYPWGGEKISKLYGHHAHDLYLDLYNEAGIFALITVIIYIIASLSRMVKCLRSNRITSATKLLILCTYVGCNVQFWLEPITKGMPWLLAAYCFMDGAITYLLMREQDSQEAADSPALPLQTLPVNRKTN